MKLESVILNAEAVILNALEEAEADHPAMTFEEVVRSVAERLEANIRETLNALAKAEKITRLPGGRDHDWRYQAKPRAPINKRI
jgi:hypothetical protein